MRVCVMLSAAKLKVVEPVRPSSGERDAVMYDEGCGPAANDAPSVTPTHELAQSAPLPAGLDLAPLSPAAQVVVLPVAGGAAASRDGRVPRLVEAVTHALFQDGHRLHAIGEG